MTLTYVLSGFAVGMLVGLTGVGRGSLMTPLLSLLFGIITAVAVGTGLAFAAPGHWWLGSIHWMLLGSATGITTGSMLARSVPETFLRGLLATTRTSVAAKLVL
jgi:hypothetical protein